MGSTSGVDVLIVGAGPVGLFLANDCARRGLSYRIIEARSSQSTHSKALAIFPRTLEVFDMAGLVAPFMDAANRVTSISVVAHQRPLTQLRFEPEGTPYSFIASRVKASAASMARCAADMGSRTISCCCATRAMKRRCTTSCIGCRSA